MSSSKLLAIISASAVALGSAGVAEAGSASKKSPVPGKPGTASIVQTAIAVNAQNGEFDYLIAAATCEYFDGAVVDLLGGTDKYTLFAPTDAAFEALIPGLISLGLLPQGTPVEPASLCELDSGVLFNVLAYHVTDGRRFSNSVFNKRNTKMIEMLNGQYIVANPNLTISDNAGQTVGVVRPFVNVNASNGVIHVIDKVLLP
jgi:transforming growth factor-beta-induced protein